MAISISAKKPKFYKKKASGGKKVLKKTIRPTYKKSSSSAKKAPTKIEKDVDESQEVMPSFEFSKFDDLASSSATLKELKTRTEVTKPPQTKVSISQSRSESSKKVTPEQKLSSKQPEKDSEGEDKEILELQKLIQQATEKIQDIETQKIEAQKAREASTEVEEVEELQRCIR